ncbi:MAG TPA: hypothetical protein VJ945_04445 [Flavobacteriaceae bacterium]|nr:hypothetical protein [Flavobacteriaceae bacterium]
MKNWRRFWATAILAWIVFIGLDFLFHASLLKSLWQEEVDAFKSPEDLFILIPSGYLSFLLLTLLTGYCFTKIYPTKPSHIQATRFTLIFGLLYTVGNLLGLYSYVNIPLKHLVIYNLVYFVEITAVVFIYYKAMYRKKLKKVIWYCLLTFFLSVFVGVVIQNII